MSVYTITPAVALMGAPLSTATAHTAVTYNASDVGYDAHLEQQLAVRGEQVEVGGAQALEQLVHALTRLGEREGAIDLICHAHHQLLRLRAG